MWSRKWHNLPPPQRNKVLHFPIEMPNPLSKPKILCCNACPPTTLTQKKSTPLGYLSHYLREQAEASRFCQVDPATVSSCVARLSLGWLGLAWLARVLLACLANLPGVCLIFCTFKLQFKSWECYVRVCDRWRITDSHTYTHTTRHHKHTGPANRDDVVQSTSAVSRLQTLNTKISIPI
jgi:hypothetical protein